MQIDRRSRCFSFALAATLCPILLIGCAQAPAPGTDADSSEPAAPASEPAPEPAPEQAAEPAPPPTGGIGGDNSATVGGDGSPIALAVLDEHDVAGAALGGELACAFVDGGGGPLLHATGVVASDDPALGVVKVGDTVEMVRAPGGFDGILVDPVFSARGMTLRIRITGEATGGGESPPRPATLTILRADGASRSIEGQWQCGP